MRGSPSERFWAKVEKLPCEPGCWLWTACLDGAGYGRFGRKKRNGPSVLAHRVAYEALRGEIPDGLQIDHLCRVRCCVNPWHLEPVTIRENQLRGTGVSAKNAAKTHCLRGHLLPPRARSIRVCRACTNARWKARWPQFKLARQAKRAAIAKAEGR